jgi:ABC-type Fe3+/spermidine/putrescine transport system ATPase subunit
VSAVAGATLVAAPGEFFTILGPSGPARHDARYAGFVHPRGEIYTDSDRAAAAGARHRNGLPELRAVPHLSVYEASRFRCALPRGALKSAGRRDARHGQLDGWQRMPHQLRRAATARRVARGIVFRPRVLLLDEPLGAPRSPAPRAHAVRIKRLQRRLRVACSTSRPAGSADDVGPGGRDEPGRIEQVGTPEEL